MKRAVTGGAHRGPVAPTRQRRTIRFVQLVLGLFSIGMIAFGVYAIGARDASQAGVLMVLGLVFAGAAYLLSDGPSVRIPTPARLDELAGRAEQVALNKITG
ncbi:MAG: hypothetical protein LC808_23500 [Actinobacteria bacterium]|nr:hypothetical protein [Actinomycetota bacterium]